MSGPALRLQGLTAGYRRDLPIVAGLDVEVQAGEIVAVLGPNGAGKSTAIKAVAGLVPVSAGRIMLGGAEVTGLPTHRRVRAGLAFVPQTENVFARLSVRDNLQLGCFGDQAAFLASLERVLALFPDLGRLLAVAAGLLSGGQRQMVAIGRALMTAPRLLLLDEPSAGLAPVVTEQLLAQLDRIRRGGVAVVLVEQNVRAALAVADRAIVLVDGRVRMSGPAAAVAADPALGALFLAAARDWHREAPAMIQYVADGIVFGAVVALGTIGLGILFNLLRFPNFAHGDFLTMGAYWTLLVGGLGFGGVGFGGLGFGAGTVGPWSFGWALLPGLVVAAAAGSCIALVIDRVLYRPIRRRGGDRKTLIIAAFAVAMILRNAIVLGFGPDERYFSNRIPRAVTVLPGVRLTPDDMLVLAVTLLVVIFLHLFMRRTRLGKELRATAENPDLARVAGIDTASVLRVAWVLASTLAALAGVGYGLTVQIRPEMGFDLLLPMFTALVLGGVGSPLGSVVAAMIVGVVESLSVLWLVPEYKQAVSFAVVFVVLMIRPQGLFGERA